MPPESAWRPLAEAMSRLAGDPAAARGMGRRWPQEVLARFDYRAATREIMEVYQAAATAGLCGCRFPPVR
jgi:glycosyltransferase involved in cell wall biosynthesis